MTFFFFHIDFQHGQIASIALISGHIYLSFDEKPGKMMESCRLQQGADFVHWQKHLSKSSTTDHLKVAFAYTAHTIQDYWNDNLISSGPTTLSSREPFDWPFWVFL